MVQHLHLLLPALRSSAIRPEEEELRVALEKIDEEVRRPGGLGKMRGKLNELWALLGAVNAARERDRQNGNVKWAVVDEEGLGQITQVCTEFSEAELLVNGTDSPFSIINRSLLRSKLAWRTLPKSCKKH